MGPFDCDVFNRGLAEQPRRAHIPCMTAQDDDAEMDRIIRALVPPEMPVPFTFREFRENMKKRPTDANKLAKQVLGEAIANAEKNPAAVALGRLGGLRGGKARADSLSTEQRSDIARKAAAVRWKKQGS